MADNVAKVHINADPMQLSKTVETLKKKCERFYVRGLSLANLNSWKWVVNEIRSIINFVKKAFETQRCHGKKRAAAICFDKTLDVPRLETGDYGRHSGHD